MLDSQFDASSEPVTWVAPAPSRRFRPFIGIQFQCCGVYSRIYLNNAETAFAGNCPRCGKRIQFPVSEDGSSERFFTVY
jgi:hypothetical protein